MSQDIDQLAENPGESNIDAMTTGRGLWYKIVGARLNH